MANNINFGKIYDSTWWGVGVTSNTINWGKSYLDLAGGGDERFIITVKTDNAGTSATNQFTLPTTGTGYNYDIETSDGQSITGLTSGTTITFPTAGTYDIFISGSFPQCYFNNVGDRLKLLDIKNFGIYALGSTSQENAFWGCLNMIISATDIGHFENVTNFIRAWRDCSSLTSFPPINTSNGTIFQSCWQSCSSLTSFPSNLFDTNTATNYLSSFTSTNLTTQSIDDILVSLDTSGVSNGTFNQSGGQGPSTTGQNAITTLTNRGWTITTTT